MEINHRVFIVYIYHDDIYIVIMKGLETFLFVSVKFKYRISSNYGTPPFIFNLANDTEYCLFGIFTHFSRLIQQIIHTKFYILGFYFMTPPQGLVLESGTIFRGNKVATLKEIYEHLKILKIASPAVLLAVTKLG